jgi:hypothetical protein
MLLANPGLLREAAKVRASVAPRVSRWWPGASVYYNRETGRQYKPHHAEEISFLESSRPRYLLAKGSEGSGKSTAGIIKDLERLRHGLSGILGSNDFEQFKRSLWPEFQRWCPPNALVESQRHRLSPEWIPRAPFILTFKTPEGYNSQLICGGFDDPTSWEGPNVNFAHWDEARRNKTPAMLKVLDGRCRIPGPNGEPPQIYITSTPRKHWMYQYFVGPLDPAEPDQFEDFRSDSRIITLLVADNEVNLSPGFVEKRRQTLTENEAKIIIDAEWQDEEDTERFLEDMIWWDRLAEQLPVLGRKEPMILAADAATGRKDSRSDCFALVGVTRHPDKLRSRTDVAIRYVNMWQAKAGKVIQFRTKDPSNPGPEDEIRRLCKEFNVLQFTYDPYQLVDMSQRLMTDRVVWCEPFGQGVGRNASDRRLLEVVQEMRIAHNGDPRLRSHIDNADRVVDTGESKLRLVKGRGKIDLAVATSMGTQACLELNM